MAVRVLNGPVTLVDDKFTALVLADLATIFDGLGLVFKVLDGALATTFFDVPTAVTVRYDVMRFPRHLFVLMR